MNRTHETLRHGASQGRGARWLAFLVVAALTGGPSCRTTSDSDEATAAAAGSADPAASTEGVEATAVEDAVAVGQTGSSEEGSSPEAVEASVDATTGEGAAGLADSVAGERSSEAIDASVPESADEGQPRSVDDGGVALADDAALADLEALALLADLQESVDAEAPAEVHAVAGEARRPEVGDDLRRARELLADLERREGSGGATELSSEPDTSAASAPASAADAASTAPASEAASSATEDASAPVTRSGEGAEAPPAKPTPIAQDAGTAPPEGAAPEAGEEASPEPVARPAGYITFKTLWHKSATEAIRFLRESRPDWVDKGHVAKVEGKAKSLVIFGETDDPNDPTTQKIVELVERFDDLDLQLERRVIKPRYIQVEIAMDALVMSGLANVWASADTQDVLAWKEGGKNRSLSRSRRSYVDQGLTNTGIAPIPVPPKVPYVYNMPREDPFAMPPINASSHNGSVVMTFDQTSSTEDRGGMMTVGTVEDLDRIQAFVDSIDTPARRIMIEVQLVELEANKLQDIGFDSIQFGEGHHIANLALPLPGEQITQPGLGPDARADPEQFVPDVVSEGLSFFYDDTSFDLQGRFLTSLHALIREGEAKVKARPKILTLDDRSSVLHLGRDVPTFVSTRVTRDTNNGNLVNEVNEVGTVYAGITLNIRPRVTGGSEDEIALQIEVVDNQIAGRQQVFEEDLAGIPEIVRRQYIGQARAKNHRPVILGGLIQEQDVESVNKIPLLADIPYLGYLFRRTTTLHQRTEVIIIVTPHILSEKGVDPVGSPKESVHFDTFDSVLFNDRHIIKGGDVLGLDPISKQPARGPDGEIFTESDVVDLTLLNIVRKRELVSKLNMLDSYLGEEIDQLNWIQRRWPESTVRDWDDHDQELYFRVAAICIENIKELNPDLDFEQLVLPRREIVLPTSPYRISLSYDRVKRVQSQGLKYVFRGEVFLDQEHVELLRKAASHRMDAFADFLSRQRVSEDVDARVGRVADDHGEVLYELKLLYEGAGGDPRELEGVPYPDVFRRLESAKLGFDALAAFFAANLRERYVLTPLNIGLFASDLEAFLRTTVSLKERAKRLLDLEKRWETSNEDEEHAGS